MSLTPGATACRMLVSAVLFSPSHPEVLLMCHNPTEVVQPATPLSSSLCSFLALSVLSRVVLPFPLPLSALGDGGAQPLGSGFIAYCVA